MKKILSIVLAMIMLLGLVACKTDNQVDKSDSSSENIQTNETDSNQPVQDDINEPEEEEPLAVVGSANERLAWIIDNSRTDPEEVEVFPANINNNNGVLDLLQIAENQVLEYSVALSMMNVHAYLIAIIKPADTQDDVIEAALENYKSSMIKSFEMYLPDQLEIAKNSIIFAENGYLGLVMCDGQDKIKDNITNYLEQLDKIEIDESLAVPEVKQMSLSEAIDLNKGILDGLITDLSWDYFEQYDYTDIGSGIYIWEIPVGEDYSILVGGPVTSSNPEYIRFVLGDNTENYIDMTTDNILDYLDNEVTY